MRSLNLTVTSPIQSFTEPLTLAEVREFLNLPETSASAAATLTFPEIPDGGNTALTFAMAGAVAGDQITPAWPSTLEDGLFGTMIVTAADTVQVRLFNLSGAAITPAPQAFSARSGSAASGQSAMLMRLIVSAREVAEVSQGDVVQKQWDIGLDCFWGDSYDGVIDLRKGSVSVDLVRYRDSDGNYSTLTEGVDYLVVKENNPGLLLPFYGKSWPSFTPYGPQSILIRVTSGPDAEMAAYGIERIRTGMLQLISSWYNNRLPFEIGNSQGMNEYAYTVTALFGYGSIPRIG